jgi:hypothetical protein
MAMNGLSNDAQHGIALLHVVLLLAMVTAAAGGAATLARIEVLVSQFQRGERDAAYAAQAMIAATLDELDRLPSWEMVPSGGTHAAFADGPSTAARQIPGGGTVVVCCAAGSMTARARAASGVAWEPYAWQSLGALLNAPDVPRQYVVAWVADDPDDSDGNAGADSNRRLAVRAEAISPFGVRRSFELLVERAPVDPMTGTRVRGIRILTWHEAR